MKTYQDTETGLLHEFDDGIDPFKLDNRNIPTTLSEIVIPKPSEFHVWLNGNWVKDTEVPKGYKPPISSVPSYNPAWMAFLNPYTFVLPDAEHKLEVSIEQINLNSYDNGKLSEAVATLPLTNTLKINSLISYDGAIAIPRNSDYPTAVIALENINRIFCAILLGGLHAEVISPSELLGGSLESKRNIFVYHDGLHSRLRHKWASISERIVLMNPRTIRVSELRNAYLHGVQVINAINNFSPLFLLHGYTALIHQNRSEALSNLWIVVEQLTSFLWKNRFLSTPAFHPVKMKNRLDSLKQDNRTWSTSVKHELLWQTKFLSEDCFGALSLARKQRNDLVHEGTIPDFDVIKNLWECLFELFETASGISPIDMRCLIPVKAPELGFSEKNNFDEWLALSATK
jgi:hypothetical protein